jgi:ketosteroid isomerase-like protein
MSRENRVRGIALGILVPWLALACAPAPEAGPAPGAEPAAPARDWSAEARAGIDATNARFMEAIGRGDAAGVAEQYSADGRLLPPNAATVEGREAITEFWAGVLAAGVTGARLQTVELDAAEGRAWEVGRVEILGADGAVIDQGKYVVGWVLEDGTWKLRRDIWNSDLPAGGAPPAD